MDSSPANRLDLSGQEAEQAVPVTVVYLKAHAGPVLQLLVGHASFYNAHSMTGRHFVRIHIALRSGKK